MRLRSWIIAALLAAGFTAPAGAARAQATAQDRAAAQVLFDQGKALMKNNNFAAGCAKFEESQRLDPRIATQFKVADCQEKLGRTASAWTNFLDVVAATRAAGQKDRESVARQRAGALEKKLSRLTVEVPAGSAVEGLVVTRDGVAIGAAVWGTATPVDPGEHTIEASAPGKQAWQTTITVKTAGAPVKVSIPPLENAPVTEPPPDRGEGGLPPPTGPLATGGQVTRPRPGSPPDSGTAGATQRTIGWSLGGVGLALGVVGGAFGLLAINANDESKAHCRTPEFCSQEGLDLNRQAKDDALLSTVMLAGGGAALAAGVVVLLTAPSKRKTEAAATLRAAPWLGPGAGGTAVMGTW